jgi:hypothetical protein
MPLQRNAVNIVTHAPVDRVGFWGNGHTYMYGGVILPWSDTATLYRSLDLRNVTAQSITQAEQSGHTRHTKRVSITKANR